MNKKKMILISIIVIMIVIGFSYASWIITLTQSNSNVIGSKCFNLTLSETNPINLTSAYPITDEEGASLTPFDFTITNTCNSYASYQVNLEILNNTTLASSEVKVMLDNGTPFLLSSKASTTTTLSNATSAYALTTGYLDPNESVTYHLRLWIKEDSTTETSANKIFSSKITIAAGYKETVTNKDRCELEYGEGAAVCNIIAEADPTNEKCLHTDSNGMITDYNATMADNDTPIVCTMEDDYGTSYYLRGLHTDNNVKFADMCWKIMRTTGTGGIKLIYNGDLDGNGTCTTTSGDHIGVEYLNPSLSGNRVYGTSYTKEGSTYTLIDTSTLNFTTDSESIIGKYTCGNTNTSCANPYYILSIPGNYAAALKLGVSTNYAQIGQGWYNPTNSVAYVGYMFNDVYGERQKTMNNTNNYYYGESFTYDNGIFTLNNVVQIADLTNSTNQTLLNTHHYTCFKETDNTCSEMYYIFDFFSGNETKVFYIILDGNETVHNALSKMIINDGINVKNSDIKEVIDWWYKQIIKDTNYENKLEDTIFCNDRTIVNIGAWSETGNILSDLTFNAYNKFTNQYIIPNPKYNLKCPNKRDAFTVSDTTNGNGALIYPIGLLTTTEASLTGNYNANKTNTSYWLSTPYYYYSEYGAQIGTVGSDGNYFNSSDATSFYYKWGIRPSISLKSDTKFISGGDGTASNPYVVDMNS